MIGDSKIKILLIKLILINCTAISESTIILNPKININDYEGVFALVYGNNKKYSFHIRTGSTLAPWQYYSYKFLSTNKWTEIKAPFLEFKKSNFYQPKNLSNQKMKSIGLVAGFEDFKADICLAKIGLY